MPITGGNTQIASGGMNAAGTRYQAEKGIKDTWQLMYEDTLKGGKDRGIPALLAATRPSKQSYFAASTGAKQRNTIDQAEMPVARQSRV